MHDAEILQTRPDSATEKRSRKFCTMQCTLPVHTPRTFPIRETPKNCVNIDDFRCVRHPLHNFRVTGLWTACTPLIKHELQNR